MSLGEHQSNADFYLDEQKRKKFDAAAKYRIARLNQTLVIPEE